MRVRIKNFIKINIGILTMAIGLYFFLIPANLAVGGVTGLGMVINSVFPKIPIGILMTIFNVILFFLGFLIFGNEFGGYTIYCSFLLSGTISILELFVPLSKPIVDDILLNLIFGIIIQGIGMAVVFTQNASTGGTDIVAKIINKFTHLEMGKALLLSDFLITLSAGLTFGVELGLYALLGIMINALVIDKVIAGFNTKINAVIISDESKNINNFIIDELERGTTIYKAVGGYSNRNKDIINVLLDKKEYIKLKKFVKTIDKEAFISISSAYEVLGEGFDLALRN